MNEATVNGPLADLAVRINRFRGEIHELAHKLEQHAEAVHGPQPEQGSNTKGSDTVIDQPVGALPTIRNELDALEHAISRLAYAAGLNTTLA